MRACAVSIAWRVVAAFISGKSSLLLFSPCLAASTCMSLVSSTPESPWTATQSEANGEARGVRPLEGKTRAAVCFNTHSFYSRGRGGPTRRICGPSLCLPSSSPLPRIRSGDSVVYAFLNASAAFSIDEMLTAEGTDKSVRRLHAAAHKQQQQQQQAAQWTYRERRARPRPT